jgi:hypothetical protein
LLNNQKVKQPKGHQENCTQRIEQNLLLMEQRKLNVSASHIIFMVAVAGYWYRHVVDLVVVTVSVPV